MKHYVFLRRAYPEIAWGGCEIQILDCLKKIDYAKYSITVATNVDIYSEKIKEAGLPAKVVLIPFDLKDYRSGRFMRMARFLKCLKPSTTVLIQGAFTDFTFSDFLAAFIASKGSVFAMEMLGAPQPDEKITTIKPRFPGLNLWWHKKMFLYKLRGFLAKRTLTVGNEMKRRLIEWYNYPADRIFTVYNQIDTQRFSPDENIKKKMRQDLKIKDSDTVIVSTARLSPEKNIAWLISAVGKILQEKENIYLLIIGDGALRSSSEKLANSINHGGRIKFLGFQRNIADYLKAADIFALSSSVEGLSSALIEAMASGLISVSTKTSGAEELIQSGYNGYTCDIDAGIFYQHLKKACLMSPPESMKMKNNARGSIVKLLSSNAGQQQTPRLLELEESS